MPRIPDQRPIDRLDYQLLGTKFRWTRQRAHVYELLKSPMGRTRQELARLAKGRVSERGVYFIVKMLYEIGLVEALVGSRYRQVPRLGATIILQCPGCNRRWGRHNESTERAVQRHFGKFSALPPIWHIEAREFCALCRHERQIERPRPWTSQFN